MSKFQKQFVFYKYFILLVVALSLILSIPHLGIIYAQSPTGKSQSVDKSNIDKNIKVPGAPINLTISPIFVNLTVNPGEETSSQIRISNNNSFTESFKINIAKYTVGQGGERLNIVPLAKEDEFGKWVKFSEPEFAVSSNQTKTIKFTIAPPKDAALGYYYAFIIQRVKEQAAGKTPLLTGAPAFTAILEVKSPNANRELQFVSFNTDKSFYEYLPTTFNITFKNTGNLHVVPHGDIFIDQGSKKEIAILKINEGQGNILPGATRTYTATWDDGFLVRKRKIVDGKEQKDDKGNFVTETKWDFTKADKFRIGSYKANLLSIYDNGKRDIPLESHLSFWVFPWKIVGAAVVILLLAVLGLKEIILSNIRKLRKKNN